MSREIASLWNVFLNSKLFLFLSTPKTYKQQYLTQLCQKCPSRQPIFNLAFQNAPNIAICLYTIRPYRSVLWAVSFMSGIFPHPREILGGSLNKYPVIPRPGRYPALSQHRHHCRDLTRGPYFRLRFPTVPPTNPTTRLGFPLCGLWVAFAATTNRTCCQNDHSHPSLKGGSWFHQINATQEHFKLNFIHKFDFNRYQRWKN